MTDEERVDPPYIADERTMLTTWLDWQRATLLQKCSGLTPDQLREQAVPPSNLSLLGLVRHMAEVERGWFRKGVAREDIGYRWVTEDHQDADFDDVADVDDAGMDAAFEALREEIGRARRAVAAAPTLDVTFTRPNRPEISLRWVLVHMVEEYARHNGHADFLRERIDGVTGD
ncbi:MAG: hypothetical protein QOG97_113 [Acidimicrobiaceae bacterium]|nr:hypothetical protein [Acidimicrobiaceae bacterium]MDQ1439885.1 hypothetical protein [Acidimicrobiaceae bacterium]